jgi:hypothetical protein
MQNQKSIQLFLKNINITCTFYRNFILLSLIITAICLRAFWLFQFKIFFAIFWFKIVTLAITYYFIDVYKRKEYYYYQNLGISKLKLWTITLGFDFALFISLIILVSKFNA